MTNPSVVAKNLIWQMANVKAANPEQNFITVPVHWLDPHYCIGAKMQKRGNTWLFTAEVSVDIEDGRCLESNSVDIGYSQVNWNRAIECLRDTAAPYCRR